jgi:putative alpha-1,2-mannosidase
MGCQSAFYMLYTAGMYPIMGQDLYILTPPVLEHTVFGAAGQGAARIEISAPAAGYGTYIDAVRLNGTSIDRLWFRHAEVAAGARIELDLVDHRSAFGSSNSPPAGE